MRKGARQAVVDPLYSREEFFEQVWGYEYGNPQIVTAHTANLPKKVKTVAPGSQLIETVQDIGYRLVTPPPTPPSSDKAAPSDPPSKPNRTRIIVGSVVAGVVILVGLGLGLWLGLG